MYIVNEDGQHLALGCLKHWRPYLLHFKRPPNGTFQHTGFRIGGYCDFCNLVASAVRKDAIHRPHFRRRRFILAADKVYTERASSKLGD
jgi:hypothetical protein